MDFSRKNYRYSVCQNTVLKEVKRIIIFDRHRVWNNSKRNGKSVSHRIITFIPTKIAELSIDYWSIRTDIALKKKTQDPLDLLVFIKKPEL